MGQMLWCFLGFGLGVGLVSVCVALLQYLIIRGVAPALGYHFHKYVFHTKEFRQEISSRGG